MQMPDKVSWKPIQSPLLLVIKYMGEKNQQELPEVYIVKGPQTNSI